MRETCKALYWIVCILVVAGCGFPRPADVGDDISNDAAPGDAVVDSGHTEPVLPSCAMLAATCGVDGHENCCQSLDVSGGTYYRLYDVGGDSQSKSPIYPATVSAFQLDRYEVTVGRFRSFVDAGEGTQANPPGAGAGAHAKIPGTGWDSNWNTNLAPDRAALLINLACSASATWTDSPGANENKPISCISWYEAFAFCAWDGGYLPTEAEWNFAAAGGDEQRPYPWSSPPTSLAIDNSRAAYVNSTSTVLQVGAKPAGDARWGHSDMAGNASEWVFDALGSYQVPCIDCVNVDGSGSRTFRGGGFTYGATEIRTTSLKGDPPTYRFINLGVRCARPK